MSFSPDDIQGAIEKLVLSSIRRPYDTLGTRRTDVSFSDVQEAAAGVFLLVTSAPFYVAYLGAQTLLELVQKEEVLIDELLSAIEATGRKVFPIEDLTSLNNASSALFELEAAVGRRSQNFKTIESVPAYQRFKTNMDEFLATAGANIKANGTVVQTPQEARAVINGLVKNLKESHAELVRRAGVLADALNNYTKVNLPALAAAGVISRARRLVQEHSQTLEALGTKARLSVIRSIVLDLLSSKAVVKKYGSFALPGTLLDIAGVGFPYSDASRPANGGNITGDIRGPFSVLAGRNVLDLWYDTIVSARFSGQVDSIVLVNGFKARFNRAAGSYVADGVTVGDIVYVLDGLNASTSWMVLSVAPNFLQAMGSVTPQPTGATSVEIWPASDESIPLALSYVASVDGTVREPFTVVFGQNDQITIGTNGVQNGVTFPAGVLDAEQICTEINDRLTANGTNGLAVAEPYLSPLRYDGIVDVVIFGITATFTLQTGTLDGLGVAVGDTIQILSGPAAGVFVTVTVVGSSPTVFVKGDDATLVNELSVRIQIGASSRKVRVRCRSAAAALSGGHTISVGASADSVGGALLLGFPPGALFTSRRTRALDLVADFKGKTSRGTAERALTATTDATLARSKPETTNVVVLYRFRGTGDIIATPGTISIRVAEGLLAAGVRIGDIAVLRTGADPDSIWTITSVTDAAITATGVITTTSAAGIEVEIGPDLSPLGRLLQVTSGPNIGDYPVVGFGPVPFDLLIDGFLPVYKDAFTQPVFFSASLNSENVKIYSKNTTTASRVTLHNFGAGILSSGVPLSGGGTTPWIKLPAVPGDLRVGDFLDLYGSSYLTPDESFSILLVDRSARVAQLDHGIDSTLSRVFGDQPPPFVRLRSGRVFDYSVLQMQLSLWAALAVNQSDFFVDLNRFLNPLLINENPTDGQIHDAKMRLLDLAGVLSAAGAALADVSTETTLETYLKNYSVEPVVEVDALFQSFKEKGSDRAIDLLTEGQFTTFFGLTLDGASYAGDLQEKMRLIARQDLPVRKVDRADARASRRIVEIEDTDYEYSKDDIDDVQIDPPVE